MKQFRLVWSDAEIPRDCQMCERLGGCFHLPSGLDCKKICASTEAWQWKFWNCLSGCRQESHPRRGTGGDLDYKIQEYKEAGNIFPENQIMEWFIQLLLGVDYMHERRILHRDLKSKNIFLKNNRLKIGDFGVSRLLVGSCDLATTLTGTPHYMSPEALKHQGYDTKSDIWSLACILYEMCCMSHAFTGSNFLSIVLKIVEGDTPSLPERHPRELNAIMESMLNKNPSLRPSAIEILKIPYIDEQLQHLMCRYSEMVPVDKNLDRQKETARIINAVKTVEGKCEENTKRRQELRSQNFEQLSSDVPRDFNQPTSEGLPVSQLLPKTSPGHADRESGIEDTRADLGHHVIPEDPFVAEEYYADVFDSCSEESEEQEEEILFSGPEREVKDGYRTNQQDSDIEALIRCLENVLSCTSLDTRTITTSVAADTSPGTAVVSSALAGTKVKRLRELAVQKLGAEVFEEVYTYLKRARHQNTSEAEIQEHLEKVVPQASDCFEVDQLLYFEEQLLIATGRESAF
ncbi:serine/threonine-protein kinase Nek11 isoform X2 [Oryctolagus cuniculus]|uniref:serine/threonine-protein kinase Nek11 isoform X2 n=1 Tax=Oryctolagus cuniculus TaxID=9986 RepID=UPI0022315EA5|nr:serine/threonine-protein kinase Nek11 isoform X2 [Oryctolagus cuniculus]XP_051674429.1 serine/threonine-protein kinase Nek11 isoform X2 [Oryctolagus cuniculus]XP_051674430.1 serine/threonine-protein kinase Nek11 isoform X2 [Oryctolagus cuniculus]XP_051674431.1 serine/threonine-protein kinase Nek11 isoform X2 [Oryctolagus cuniculus]XP_051674432.1 serine/threonine-protein kinase Nek11 isoform X2 [Oryctolagus cuniculus]XP_051674433.1 serine/threonine-protein kinase Nek11 isoform X2 [Oryctolagu